MDEENGWIDGLTPSEKEKPAHSTPTVAHGRCVAVCEACSVVQMIAELTIIYFWTFSVGA